MANAISIIRIIASIALLFCRAFSPAFYVLYIAAGLSDMLDGFVARKTDTVSRFGARLDTIADFVLVIVCLIKLLPILRIPAWLYLWIGIIALIKAVNIVSGFAVQKRFVAVHSLMNKATGALLFLLPLTIPAAELKYAAIVVCAARRLPQFRRDISSEQEDTYVYALTESDWRRFMHSPEGKED